MVPLRIRHPNGVSTIQVSFEDFTVADLQQEIYAVTDILPASQELKSGYPPRSLTLVSELPLASLGIKTGEQIIVSKQESSSSTRGVSSSNRVASPPVLSSMSAPPARTASSTSTAESSGVLDHVEVDGSFLVHRVVPDDNSCLFSAVALVFEQDITKASQMRQIVGRAITSNPTKYSAAILGMPATEYITKITSPSVWGGAIELGIFAEHFKTEIASIDVETGRIDQFAAFQDSDAPRERGQQQEMRCILIYSGIHYDAATLAPMADAPAEWHQTIFPATSSLADQDPILKAAKSLATILRGKRAYTNTSTFDLKCEICGTGIKGERNAREHASATGHTKFGEY